MQTNNLSATGLLRLPEVLAIFPVGKSTWYAGIAQGKYPKSVMLSPRIVAWKIQDIMQLIEGVSNSREVTDTNSKWLHKSVELARLEKGGE